jgi:BolA protein
MGKRGGGFKKSLCFLGPHKVFDILSMWCFKAHMTTGMEDILAGKLARALQPSVLEIVNESARHSGHAGDDGSGESHFHALIVSDKFTGKSRIERQRQVYEVLRDEMAGKIHALSLRLLTNEEYSGM